MNEFTMQLNLCNTSKSEENTIFRHESVNKNVNAKVTSLLVSIISALEFSLVLCTCTLEKRCNLGA